ncbi:MAG: helix-turn-helix domain-containing protein, partial [Hoeflea sp.]|nr:helix-turn-helix domain-containing protein [Hoeflea sp.]
MTISSPHARALAALGHDARLSIFRLLVRAGEDGLRVGDIGEHLELAPSTLAHHLSSLVDAGLVLQDKRVREVFNRVD